VKKISLAFVYGLILMALCFITGCGGGGSAHGATDPKKAIEVVDETPTFLFPDGTQGGLDTLRTQVVKRLKVDQASSLGFISDGTGYSWIVQTIHPQSRAATSTHRQIIHIKLPQTRSSGARFNILLTVTGPDHSTEDILITDSVSDINLLAVGFSNSTVVTDSPPTEFDLSQVIAKFLPQGSPQSVEESTATACLEGFFRQ
jgi:hypothetical protein